MTRTVERMKKRRRRKEEDVPLLDQVVKPLAPERIAYHRTRLAELEQQGRWGHANDLSLWLCGPLMTYREWGEGKWPVERVEFLKRMRRACRAKRAAAGKRKVFWFSVKWRRAVLR